jgi:hypothetical protein
MQSINGQQNEGKRVLWIQSYAYMTMSLMRIGPIIIKGYLKFSFHACTDYLVCLFWTCTYSGEEILQNFLNAYKRKFVVKLFHTHMFYFYNIIIDMKF